MKRVYCLYRVSTTAQVEKNDLPMQKQACHAFAKTKGWQILRELYEKGVSGFTCPAENREALQLLKEAAQLHPFLAILRGKP